MKEDNPLIHVSMQMILHAGDARLNISEAIKSASLYDFEKAEELMKEAQQNINLAHQSQTNVIQNEMAGKEYEPCILFAHAQDTLMTITSEMKFAEQFILLYNKIQELEAKETASHD